MCSSKICSCGNISPRTRPHVSQAEFDKAWQEVSTGSKKQKKTLDEFYKESGMDETIVRRDLIAQLQWKAPAHAICPDDKAKEYYEANKPFFDKIKVRASHILIKLDAKATKDQRDKATQQMLVWRQEILAGRVKFEDVAKKFSECPSKDNKPLPPWRYRANFPISSWSSAAGVRQDGRLRHEEGRD